MNILSQKSLQALGCKMWLPFNGNALDFSGNGRNGAITGMTYQECDDGGRTGYFDGGDYVNLGNTSLISANEYSLLSWVKTTYSGADQGVINQDGSSTGSNRYFQFRVELNGKFQFIRFRSAGAIAITSTQLVNDGNWHMISAAFSTLYGSKIYIDGVNVANSTDLNANLVGTAIDNVIGGRKQGSGYSPTFTELFRGNIRNSMVFNKYITPRNFRRLYNATYIE